MEAGLDAAHAHDADAGLAALMPPPPGAPRATHPRWRRALPTLIGLVGGGAGGFVLAMVGTHLLDGLPGSAVFALLAGMLLSLWPHIVLHEAGHAVAGLSRGMHAIAFGVGPVRIERGSGDRWRWRRGGGVRGIGGFAALLPKGARGLSRIDQMVFLSGGPLANFMTALVLLGCSAALPLHAAVACVGAALTAAAMGTWNLVPLHVAGWRSDGRGLLDLLRRTPDAALQLQINQVMALSLAGVRPRDWPDAAMPDAGAAIASTGLQQSGRMLRLSRAIDRRDAQAARSDALALTAAFNDAPPVFQSAIAVTLASHAALLVGDRRLVSAWRLRCEGGLMDLSPYRAWLDAEIARLDGDGVACTAQVERARGLVDRIPDAASRMVLQERLDVLAHA